MSLIGKCITLFTVPIEITNCPDDILITTSVPSAINWREPTAASDGAVALESVSHQPGTTFPLGSTEVMYVFTDECGQKARCSFNVTLSELSEFRRLYFVRLFVNRSISC